MSGRSWLRDHFLDHPGLALRDPAATAKGGKPKLICKYCYPNLISGEKTLDQNKLQNGLIYQARTEELIIRQRKFFDNCF
ncbi:hypothetical protein EV360DRAFT_84106 [Lentinula raphanica]|nr:hypothetical protein EV360DRAFT_84106 [Lentinula raphanica]